jgi:hypothetical protein
MSKPKKRQTSEPAVKLSAPTPDDITPLELATLAARLVNTGLVERGEERRCLAGALEFLKTSAEVLNVARVEREYRANQSREQLAWGNLMKDKKPGDLIPVDDLLDFAGVTRITLKPDELRSIGITDAWDALPESARRDAIYLFLTRERVSTRHEIPIISRGMIHKGEGSVSAGSLENRTRAVREGVPVQVADIVVRTLDGAHKKRQREIARQAGAAPKKKRKPRAPKGDDGKFQTKILPPQASDGKFRKKRER